MPRETSSVPLRLDVFDVALLDALQRDGAMTNGALPEVAHLSPSPCSRRRMALQEAGLIQGCTEGLDATTLGFGLRAIVRVSLRSLGQEREAGFARFLAEHTEGRSAFSVSGDADDVLDVHVRDLESFAAFVHAKLLPPP